MLNKIKNELIRLSVLEEMTGEAEKRYKANPNNEIPQAAKMPRKMDSGAFLLLKMLI